MYLLSPWIWHNPDWRNNLVVSFEVETPHSSIFHVVHAQIMTYIWSCISFSKVDHMTVVLVVGEVDVVASTIRVQSRRKRDQAIKSEKQYLIP